MGLNIGGFITGFLAQSEKIHRDQIQDDTLKLKQGQAADQHTLTQAHANYYNALVNSKTAGGVSAKDASVIARRAEGVRASQAKDKRDAERFDMQKKGQWDPSGRGAAGPKGAIQLDEAPGAVQAAQDRLGPAPTQGAIPGMNGAVRPWPGDGGPAVGGASRSLGAPGAASDDATSDEEPDTTTDPDDDDGDDEETTQRYAAGGMVSKPAVGRYAEGGAVQPQQQAPAPQQAQPAIGGAPQQQMPPVQDLNSTPDQSGQSWNNDVGFDTKKVLAGWKAAPEPAGKTAATDGVPKSDPTNVNAARFSLSAMQDVYRNSKGASALDAGHQSMVDAVTKKENAMTDAQYKQLGQAVDPRGQLNESAGYIARLDATIKSSLARGDQKAAKALSTSLVEYGMLKSEQFGNYALDLMKKGDMQGAVHFLEKAYDFQPDGKSLKATVGPDGLVHAHTVDADGTVTDLGKFSGQQVLKVTLGLANGSEYVSAMNRVAAGGRAEKPAKEAKPMAVPKLSDRTNAAKNVEDAASGFELDKKTEGAVKSIASQIHTSNDADPAASLRAALKLTDVKNAPTYKLTPGQDGSATAEFQDGSVIKLSRNTLAQIAVNRVAAQKGKDTDDAKAAETKATEDKKQGLIKDMQGQQAAERDKQRSKVLTPGAMGRGAYVPELDTSR